MQYSVVRAEDSYVVTVDGQGLLKLASRRQAVKLVTHVMEAAAGTGKDAAQEIPASACEPEPRSSEYRSRHHR